MTITATTRAIVYRDCCTTTTDAHGCLITIYMVILTNCPTTNAMKIDQLFTSRLLTDVDFQNHVTDVQGGPAYTANPLTTRRFDMRWHGSLANDNHTNRKRFASIFEDPLRLLDIRF